MTLFTATIHLIPIPLPILAAPVTSCAMPKIASMSKLPYIHLLPPFRTAIKSTLATQPCWIYHRSHPQPGNATFSTIKKQSPSLYWIVLWFRSTHHLHNQPIIHLWCQHALFAWTLQHIKLTVAHQPGTSAHQSTHTRYPQYPPAHGSPTSTTCSSKQWLLFGEKTGHHSLPPPVMFQTLTQHLDQGNWCRLFKHMVQPHQQTCLRASP